MSGTRAVSYPRLFRLAATLAVFVVSTLIIPRCWCGRGADALFKGELSAQEPLAREILGMLEEGLDSSDFNTGSDHLNGKWAWTTYQMSAMGLCQMALDHPGKKDEYLPVIDRCIERLKSHEMNAFAKEKYGSYGLESLDTNHGHAYLGYFNLVLGLRRMIEPDNRYAGLHDKLTHALARRLERSPHLMIETFPHRTFVADVASVFGSIGLHRRVTGDGRHAGLLDKWSKTLSDRYIDPRSGLVHPNVKRVSGKPTGRPRGSGTALAVYFIAFADRELAHKLYWNLRDKHRTALIGFGGAHEYPRGVSGFGDFEYGPVVMGIGVTATGFSASGARIFHDPGFYGEIYRTVHLFGAPVSRAGRKKYVAGGPAGNAVMFAMFTAGPGAAGYKEGL
jgi:hypothetical protein